ncbi:MAG: IclR family transcriptional regulator [Solirubrobacteraceae bacterium]
MPRPRTEIEPEAPKVLEKALRVLEAFGDQAPSWSEAELRRHLSIPSTTLNRILRSLERFGYLVRYADGRYQLGVAAIRLGNRASRSLNLATVLQPHLRALARDTGELAMLAVPEFPAALARYIATADSASRLRVTAEVGTAVPITAGATAKAIFALQHDERIDEVLGRELRPLADGTLTDPAVLREQVAMIRERGWAFSWEETYNGAWAVVAPILDAATEVAAAAIGVAIPTARHSEAVQDAVRVAVVAATAEATRTLG